MLQQRDTGPFLYQPQQNYWYQFKAQGNTDKPPHKTKHLLTVLCPIASLSLCQSRSLDDSLCRQKTFDETSQTCFNQNNLNFESMPVNLLVFFTGTILGVTIINFIPK